MQTHHATIAYRSEKDIFRLWFIGDVHLGSRLCDEKRLARDLSAIRADSSARVFLLGDICEYIAANDWRFEPDTIAEWVDRTNVGNSQLERAIETFEPIAGKIVGAIQGNHERTIEREFNNNVHAKFCSDLDILNLGYSALVRVTYRRGGKARNGNAGDYRPLDIWLHHGYGSGRTIDANRFAEAMLGYDADLFVAGHTHQRHASKSVQYRFNPLADDLIPRTRLACRAGTYLRTAMRDATSYSERAGMRPLETGALCVTFEPHRRELIANV